MNKMTVSVVDVNGNRHDYAHAHVRLLARDGILEIRDGNGVVRSYVIENLISYTTIKEENEEDSNE